MGERRRLFRLASLAAMGWVAAECLLIYAASSRIGVLPTFAFMTFKGVGGLILLAISLKSVLRGLGPKTLRRGLSGIGAAMFSAVGAALILLPGLLTTFAGVALFSPSVRLWILGRVRKGQGREDGIISLERTEWREIRPRSGTRRPKQRSISP